MNSCSVCNNLVFGHKAGFGCMPGPGNCTVTPIPPSSLSSLWGHSAAGKGSTMASSAPSSSPNTTVPVSASVSDEHTRVTTSVSADPPVSGAAGTSTTEPSHILTNEQLEQSFRRDCDVLAAHLKEAEEQQIRNNIYGLHERKAAFSVHRSSKINFLKIST